MTIHLVLGFSGKPHELLNADALTKRYICFI